MSTEAAALGKIEMPFTGHSVTINPTPEQRVRRALSRLPRLAQAIAQAKVAGTPTGEYEHETRELRDRIEAAHKTGMLTSELNKVLDERRALQLELQRLDAVIQGAVQIGALKAS